MTTKPTKMTARQAAFVAEYLVDLNATQAAIRAGYSARNADQVGPRLVGKSHVAAAVAAAMAVRAKKTELSAEWVLSRLKANAERAAQAEAVLDNDGNETGTYRYDGAVVNRALELLGKHQGLFTDRVQLSGDPNAPLNVRVTHTVIDPRHDDG